MCLTFMLIGLELIVLKNVKIPKISLTLLKHKKTVPDRKKKNRKGVTESDTPF